MIASPATDQRTGSTYEINNQPNTNRPKATGRVTVTGVFPHGNALISGGRPGDPARPGFQRRGESELDHVKRIRK